MKQWKVTASNFIGTLSANVDNEKLSDKEFRDMVRNSIPIVEGSLVPIWAPSQSKDIVCERETDHDSGFSY